MTNIYAIAAVFMPLTVSLSGAQRFTIDQVSCSDHLPCCWALNFNVNSTVLIRLSPSAPCSTTSTTPGRKPSILVPNYTSSHEQSPRSRKS